MATRTTPTVFSIIQAGLVLGTTLAWSEVIKTGTKQIYPLDDSKVFQANVIYAIVITVILIIGFYILQKTEENVNNVKSKLEKQMQDLIKKDKELEIQQEVQNRLMTGLTKIPR